MAGPEDPIQVAISEAAAHINVDAARTTESEDPMVRMLSQAIQEGMSAEDALTHVVNRSTEVGHAILGFLDFPPISTPAHRLDVKLKEEGATDLEISAAMTSLVQHRRVDEINGWWFRLPDPLPPMTRDDLEWELGVGRYGQ